MSIKAPKEYHFEPITPPIDIPSFLEGLRELLQALPKEKQDKMMRNIWRLTMDAFENQLGSLLNKYGIAILTDNEESDFAIIDQAKFAVLRAKEKRSEPT